MHGVVTMNTTHMTRMELLALTPITQTCTLQQALVVMVRMCICVYYRVSDPHLMFLWTSPMGFNNEVRKILN